MKERKYVSDTVTEEEINGWDVGDVIYIDAPTGSGKSHFIKYDLYEKAKSEGKKILMLIHRINCVYQFKKELDLVGRLDESVIKIKTYQSIESKIRRGEIIDLSEYMYIILDEVNYFSGVDSSYNFYTDTSLGILLEHDNSIRILMSATGDNIKEFLTSYKNISLIEYKIEADFSHIKDLKFFTDEIYYEEFIEDIIEKDKKAILFINDTSEAYRLHMAYRDKSLFNCSKSNKYYRYVNKEKISIMLENEMFYENVLITTSVMDSGVNIKDIELNDIVIDINELEVLIQCIGRKRIINDEDFVNIHVKEYNNSQFNGMKWQIKNSLEHANYLAKNGEKEYVEKYGRNKKGIEIGLVYDDYISDKVEKSINRLMYFRTVKRIKELDNYINIGYKKYIKNYLGIDKYINVDKERKILTLEEYLESISGNPLYGEDKKKLIEAINLRDNSNRLQKSISLLNIYFEKNNINFSIRSKRIVVKENGIDKRRYCWIVYKLE